MIYKEFDERIEKEVNPLFNAKDKKAYREAYHKLNNEFKLALFKEYGVEDNPKAEKLWTIAWNDGHSGGYSEIEISFSNMVELII